MSKIESSEDGSPRLEFLSVLGLTLPVTEEDVKQAYLEKAKRAHPDHGGDSRQFIRLQEAFEQASEYARFKSGRMQWLSRWVEQYATQEEFVAAVQAAGGSVDLESCDWLAQSIGNDFATVLEKLVGVRLSGATVDDHLLERLSASRRIAAGVRQLEIKNAKITPAGLRHLRAFENLRHLDLSGTLLSAHAVEELISDLRRLESIGLRGTKLGWWARLKLKLTHRGLAIST